jgi:hypothetical protein
VTLKEVCEKVTAADGRGDWREVLKWEGRMEELLERQSDAVRRTILEIFVNAHLRGYNATVSEDNSLAIVRLEKRRIEVLGRMQRFRDQGAALCRVADQLLGSGKQQDAGTYFQRARKIAEAHGFFSVECESCLGLGKLAMAGGGDEEGVALLRNALVCVPLCEEENTIMELEVLCFFIDALFDTHAIDEAEPLVVRYREAAAAESKKQGRLRISNFRSLHASARLHEVL